MSPDRTETAQPLLPLPQLKLPLLDGQVQVDGIVSSQVFVSPEADFAVLRLDVAGQIRPWLPSVRWPVCESVRRCASSVVTNSDRYGQRLRADQALPQTPESRLVSSAICRRWLVWVQSLRAHRRRAWTRALIALEEETFRVAQIKGVGKTGPAGAD